MDARIFRTFKMSFPILAFILSLLAAAGAEAQDYRGSINGRVSDSSGAAVPGARVAIVGAAVPPGASLGLATFIGREVSFLPLARKNNQLHGTQASYGSHSRVSINPSSQT